VNRWVAETSRNVQYASEKSDRFYELANHLLDDERTPIEVSIFLTRLAKNACSAEFADWVSKNARRFTGDPPESAFSKALRNLPNDLREPFAECVMSALAASASSHPLFPDLLRKRMESALEDGMTEADDEVVRDGWEPQREEADIPPPFQAAEPVERAAARYVFEHPALVAA
jgi:DNA-binding SARP family transcriptional activator